MIHVVRCPAELECSHPLTTFLAGGITGCPDWQNEFITLAEKYCQKDWNRYLVDPRRANFDTSNPKMTEEQIAWEYRHLRRVNQIVFWFPKETPCPITLFELGSALERDQNICVGCHLEYQRAIDLKYQIMNHYQRSYIEIVHSVEDLVKQSFGIR